MSEWRNRTTRLVRDGVKVSVMSYKDTFGRGWFTMLTIPNGDNTIVSHLERERQDADMWHDNLVHIMEQTGCTVFSDEFDAKKKRPRRREPHKAQRNNISP